MQLEMFPELQIKVQEYKDSSDKVRRGVFARVDAHKKEIEQRFEKQQGEIESIRHLLEEMKNLMNYAQECVG